jgi:hypothetical protein
LKLAVDRLRERLLEPQRPARFHLVPPHFTLAELRRVYEVIFGRQFDPRLFKTTLVARDVIEPIAARAKSRSKTAPPKRASAGELYRFKHAPARRTVDD